LLCPAKRDGGGGGVSFDIDLEAPKTKEI